MKSTTSVLKTWIGLNDALRNADMATCKALLQAELTDRHRSAFLKRIQARMNRLRNEEAKRQFMDLIK